MTNIATGYVAIRADVEDLRQDLKKTKAELERATGKMQAQATKTTRSFKAMWLAYAAGAAVVAAGAMKAIKAASDLQETTSKFNVVFKGQQKLAESWSKALVDGFAMSTREAKHNLAAVQDLLVPMGMASKEAGKLSFEIVKLSADLGSFNNLPTEQVMLDIQSALVGNFETMKKYGVVLNATVVQQKAMEMGLAATKKELTAAHKAQAAYRLMVEGSQAAIGDMDRTADSYANTVKAAKAAWEDFMGALGELILPIATKVVGALSEIIGAMNQLISGAKEAKALSEAIGQDVAAADIYAEGDAMAAALGGDTHEMAGAAGAGGGGGPGEEPKAIVDMKEVMKTARELRATETEDIYGALDARLNYESDYYDQTTALREQATAANLEALDKVAEQSKKKSQLEMKWDSTVAKHKQKTTAAWVNTAVMALQLFGAENKAATIAAITIQTAFAAASAFMNTKAAAMRALAELGPIAGAPVAAAIETYGALNVAAIIAQGAMQGAAVAMTSTGGGAASVLTPQGEAVVTSPAMAPPGETREGTVNIFVEGDLQADETYMETLAEKLSELVENKEVRLVASETRAT